MISERRINFKAKLRKREHLFGAWTSLGHPSITEMMTRSGVDFVGIDIEHSTIDQAQAQQIIASAQAGGILCLPRIASHNMEMIKRLLDSGADGIIAPMVNNQRETADLVSWCKYPPRGKRSFGISRGQGYGFEFKTYTAGWNTESTLIVQIESVESVENLDMIIGNKDVDGAMLGPYDLSGSLGIPGELDHPLLKEASQKIIASCQAHNKACGTQIVNPDPHNIQQAFKDGFTFIVLASDVFVLWKWAERMAELIKTTR